MKAVIKLGGSAITYKHLADEFPTNLNEVIEQGDRFIRFDVLRSVGSQLKDIVSQYNPQIALVNGAGPFGHKMVKSGAERFEVHMAVKYLNQRICDTLAEYSIRVRSVAPSAHVTYDETFDFSALHEMMMKLISFNDIPSTYGDVVRALKGNGNVPYDENPPKQLGKVVSGDDILPAFARHIDADLVLSGTDIDGYYDNFGEENAELAKELNWSDAFLEEKTETEHRVTGEMLEKVRKLFPAVREGTECRIFNLTVPGNLKAIFDGQDIGTKLISEKF